MVSQNTVIGRQVLDSALRIFYFRISLSDNPPVPLEVLKIKEARGQIIADCKWSMADYMRPNTHPSNVAINYSEYNELPSGLVALIGRVKYGAHSTVHTSSHASFTNRIACTGAIPMSPSVTTLGFSRSSSPMACLSTVSLIRSFKLYVSPGNLRMSFKNEPLRLTACILSYYQLSRIILVLQLLL